MTKNSLVDEGMKLLEEGEYDQAIKYFSKNLNDHRAYYGLASAKIRKNPSEISTEELLEVISLYQKSIELSPDFADAYYMCGMAFSKLTTNILFAIKSEQQPASDENIEVAFSTLSNYREYINAAVKINPNFKEIAEKEAETYSKLYAAVESFSQQSD